MMTAGTLVKGGFYFNRDKLDLITVSGKEGLLPGAEGQRFLRVPVLAVLLLAPVLGGLFVMFMPFIGFALVFQHLSRLMLAGVKRAGRALAFVVTPTWRPGEAYFAGKEGEKKHAKESAEAKTEAKNEAKTDDDKPAK
jgi:hypothetical protein